ncbi:acyltransferase family protein [Sphingomonas sp.]|uniref:acyltransferase family protein n=1 Tax=Sphingomonas sp. TaxID=28214 RepID=UPI001B152AC7|nr:acyltransferase family protein [Sphingomonas sp.]MBO9712359.1 acyltransferase [Sphingomonas sp.]
MRYRADIEGLRAAAIAAVVGFHFAGPWLPNGYLGVDVFFVLSGYLITSILQGAIERGDFRLVEFYRRRTVRILPALLVMLLLVCAIGPFLLLPGEAGALAKSGAAAAAFSANVHFWVSSGYFDTSKIRPLLHSWSLGVEEQYYLLYPLALWLIHRRAPRRIGAILWAGVAVSLVLNWAVAVWYNHPNAAFYLLPTRGWELALGGVAALGGLPALERPGRRQVAALAGLALLVGALVSGSVRVALGSAVAACLGTAMLLAYGEAAVTARLLGALPMRWLGRLSYSLYLWHLPVRDLYRAGTDDEPGLLASAALLALALGLAFLSYRLVEVPIRRHYRSGGDPGRIVLVGVAASAAAALACLGLAWAVPRVRPLPPAVARVAAYAGYQGSAAWRYQVGPPGCRGGADRFDAANCLRTDPARRNVLVLGDSHAMHLWRAIAERFPDSNVRLAAATGCRPLFGETRGFLCGETAKRVRQQLLGPGGFRAVILAGRWIEDDFPRLRATITALRARGTRVLVLGRLREYRADAPRLIAHSMLRGSAEAARRLESPLPEAIEAELRPLVLAAGGTYYSLLAQECPAGRCRLLTRTGAPFHFDTAHPTMEGARELVAALPEP